LWVSTRTLTFTSWAKGYFTAKIEGVLTTKEEEWIGKLGVRK